MWPFGQMATMFVSDGYGNARVHRFSADGTLERSWGEPGNGPGEFNLPHGIGVDSAGTVYVADRENSRIQLFTSVGEYVTEWDFCNRPTDIFIDNPAFPSASWRSNRRSAFAAGRHVRSPMSHRGTSGLGPPPYPFPPT